MNSNFLEKLKDNDTLTIDVRRERWKVKPSFVNIGKVTLIFSVT